MKRYNSLVFIPIVVLLISGCMEKQIRESEYPPLHNQMLIQCCIAPGEPVEVEAHVVKPYAYNRVVAPEDINEWRNEAILLGKTRIVFTDLNTGQTVQLVQDDISDNARYCMFIVPAGEQFHIQPNHKYSIVAEHDECPSVAATTIVPNGLYEIDRVSFKQKDSEHFSCAINVSNQAAVASVYLLSFRLIVQTQWHRQDTTGRWIPFLKSEKHVPYREAFVQASAGGVGSSTLDYSASVHSVDTLVAIVKEVNEDFVRHHNAWNETRDLFTQPSERYTNIDGGLGIFCAYVGKELVLPNPLREK